MKRGEENDEVTRKRKRERVDTKVSEYQQGCVTAGIFENPNHPIHNKFPGFKF